VVAFIVGVSNYLYVNSLPNAEHDGDAMREMFEKKGVTVFSPDKNRRPPDNRPHYHIFVLRDLWGRYLRALKPGDIAFIFFAGHGCAWKTETGWKQCLIARGLTTDEKRVRRIRKKQTIVESSLQVPQMLDDLEKRGIKKHVVLLDCCREFAYKDLARAMNQEEITDDRKSDFNIEIGDGTLVGFAVQPGEKALDGDSSTGFHGHYTAALMKHLMEPDVEVHDMLDKVAETARKSSKKSIDDYFAQTGKKSADVTVQHPFYKSTLPKGTCLFVTPSNKAAAKSSGSDEEPAIKPSEPTQTSACAADIEP